MPEQVNPPNPEDEMLNPFEEYQINGFFNAWYTEETTPEEVEVAEEEGGAAEADAAEEEGGAAEADAAEEEGGLVFGGLETSTNTEEQVEDFHKAMKLLEAISYITEESTMMILVRAINRESDIIFDDLHILAKLGKISTEQLDFIEEKLGIRSAHKLLLTETDQVPDLSHEEQEEFEKILAQIQKKGSDNETDGANSDDE
jgi:hypothetical protein